MEKETKKTMVGKKSHGKVFYTESSAKRKFNCFVWQYCIGKIGKMQQFDFPIN